MAPLPTNMGPVFIQNPGIQLDIAPPHIFLLRTLEGLLNAVTIVLPPINKTRAYLALFL